MFDDSGPRPRVEVRRFPSTALLVHWACWRLSRMGVRSRARSPVRRLDGSRPRNRVRRTFLSGESDDARNGTPALARAHMQISALGAIGAYTHADTCLRSRCAGDAQGSCVKFYIKKFHVKAREIHVKRNLLSAFHTNFTRSVTVFGISVVRISRVAARVPGAVRAGCCARIDLL